MNRPNTQPTRKVEQAERQVLSGQRGHDEPIQVEPVKRQHPHRPEGQGPPVTLDMAGHETNEGHGKMAQDQRPGDKPPRSFDSQTIPLGFFRQVGVPDQHELGEGDVRPKNDEREQHLPDVVKVFCGDRTHQPASTL